MAKISTVDYLAIPGQAGQIRAKGVELNTELINAYNSIRDMHNNWYGKRYNELAQDFNNMIPQITEMLNLVVGEIPFALETVANNYSMADRGQNACSAQKSAPKKIEEVAKPNDVGMRFITTSVQETNTKVSGNFKTSVEKMNEIEGIYNKITWQSEAADSFRARFEKLKSNIIASFDNTRTQFDRLMKQAMDDVQGAESANTVQ